MVPSADPGWRQSAYQLEISRAGDIAVFDVPSSEQVFVPWPGSALQSRESALVRVRVAHGAAWSSWSEPGSVEAGLLAADDWEASFITPVLLGGTEAPAPTLVGSIQLPSAVRSARLYASAFGVYFGTINGVAVSENLLAPGWTSYHHRLRYHTYDVSRLLSAGDNRITFTLGNGWYRGRLGFEGRSAIYGDRLGMIAQLEVTLVDGSTHRLATDSTWHAVESQIIVDDLYDGETQDLRRPVLASDQSAVTMLDYPKEQLVAPDGPPIRPTGNVPAARIWTSPSGKTLIDFGQNLVGWIRIARPDSKAGTEVVVRHAEVLEHDELGTRPLRGAAATDRYILTDGGPVALEPHFTLHGFRYAEVTGLPDLEPSQVEAIVIGSDLSRRGWFSTSDRQLNRLHENIVWSMRGNFVDLPTDCPQRDERLGWTGDIQVFAPTATYLYDSSGFLSSWLKDLAAEQWEDGTVPYVVPDVLGGLVAPSPTAAWGDAATVVPWTLYERTGDRDVLNRQFDSMKRWTDRIVEAAGADHIWSGGFQFGDWLDPTAPPEDPGRAKADPALIATAYLARSTQILADAARVLGRVGDELEYSVIASDVRNAFAGRFVTADGRLQSDAPTAYAVGIVWDLFPESRQRIYAGRRLADLVRAAGFRISTGFVGTPLICDALTATGHADVAHRLLLQTECPSWLYPVTMGATSIWERWDSMLPDGTINPGEMTSFNHFALGAVGDWLHRSIAGLAPGASGYRSIRIAPLPPRELDFARAEHLTPFGPAHVHWERRGNQLVVNAQIPIGATAEVLLPGWEEPLAIEHGSHEWVIDGQPNRARFETIRDLIDDATAWAALLAATRTHAVGPQSEVRLAAWLEPFFDFPVGSLAHALAPEGITTATTRAAAAEAANEALTAALGAGATPVGDSSRNGRA
ncbi:family 78 glycoside hydrolase catalytic domain [Microbacterium sp. X-17]|uniref:family 78 glycoside hydrolase catalytic domain n=1 Tax=Microbacterium sp. X-17 TaxID=3144404 RepID=UPI0031F51964